LGNKPKEKGNIAMTNERVVRNVNYDKREPNEDHIEWWECKNPLASGKQRMYEYLNTCLRAG
jgi:hypothetical protein